MQEIKNALTERKNVFDEFISRADMVEERISELKDRLIEISKTVK